MNLLLLRLLALPFACLAVLSLVAFKQRSVTVERRDKTFRAFTSIAGQRGTLERIGV
jgi:hypothetical protein